MEQDEDNPFRPGSGLVPPHRAGHEEAVKTLGARLRRVLKGGDGDIVVLHGPRGNGKTVLLRELERNANSNGATVRVMIDSVMRGDDEMVAQYLKTGLETPRRKVKSIGIGAMSAKADLEFEGAVGPVTAQTLNALLKKKPVLLVADEAHVMPVGFGRNLLQVAQLLIGNGRPLLLVLAGTPGLRSHLRTMGATFWERAAQIPVGRLESGDAARTALSVPASQSGLPFDEDALDLLVKESQRYPFFVQLVGRRTWGIANARTDGPRRITLADAQAGVREADSQRALFHGSRREEIISHKVLYPAEQVSKAIAEQEDGVLSQKKLEEVLVAARAHCVHPPEETLDRLRDLGLIWEEDGKWEPGIPSLCSCLIEKIGTGTFGRDRY